MQPRQAKNQPSIFCKDKKDTFRAGGAVGATRLGQGKGIGRTPGDSSAAPLGSAEGAMLLGLAFSCACQSWAPRRMERKGMEWKAHLGCGWQKGGGGEGKAGEARGLGLGAGFF